MLCVFTSNLKITREKMAHDATLIKQKPSIPGREDGINISDLHLNPLVHAVEVLSEVVNVVDGSQALDSRPVEETIVT